LLATGFLAFFCPPEDLRTFNFSHHHLYRCARDLMAFRAFCPAPSFYLFPTPPVGTSVMKALFCGVFIKTCPTAFVISPGGLCVAAPLGVVTHCVWPSNRRYFFPFRRGPPPAGGFFFRPQTRVPQRSLSDYAALFDLIHFVAPFKQLKTPFGRCAPGTSPSALGLM